MQNYTFYNMAISDFRNFCFDPQKPNFDFSKIDAPQIQYFVDIQKNGIYIIELCATNVCTKFQANIFIFDCAMAHKPSNVYDVIFLILYFWNV